MSAAYSYDDDAVWKRAFEGAGDVVLQTNARIQQNTGAAASVLLKLMADSTTPASVRARASQCILEHANKSLELEDLALRLQRLEEIEKTKK